MSLETKLTTTSAEFLEDARLAALRRYNILDTAPEKAFERITALASKVFAVPVALITLVDSDRQWFKSCYGVDLRETERKVSFCTYTIQSDEVMVVPNALEDPRFVDNPLVNGDLHIRFYAGAPLKAPDGYNLGSLCLIDTEPRESFGDVQQGMLADLAAMVVDELELRSASRALQTSETKLRTVIETISDAIYIKDLEGRYTLINPAGAATLGLGVEEVLGKCDADLFGPDDATHIASVDEQLITTRKPVTYERAAETATGTKIHLTSKYPYYAHGGEPAGLIGVSRDVTAQKQAERALADSEARFRELAESINDVFWVSDVRAGGSMVYVSPAFETVWGRSLESLQERPTLFLEGIHPDDRAGVRAAFDNQVRGEGQQEYVEYRVMQPEGTVRWIRDRAFPVLDERGEVYRVVGVAEDITERKRVQEELERLTHELERRVGTRTAELAEANAQLLHNAFHDKLTGLANRALFLDRLALATERHQRRTNGGFAVLYLDSDRFKVVNDSLGHAVGDRLLIALGERLKACVRPGDTVARLGGDEFVILLEDAELTEEATRVAERIQHEARKPYVIDGRAIHTSVSIGIVMSDASYESADGFLRDADIAMYHAKALGKARYQIFTEEMRDHALSLMALENDLRGAIGRGELRVCYQPIRALQGRSLSGFEALVRWEHPRLGTVSPATFIPIAEETGLIIELDRWVLREACRRLKAWQGQYLLIPPLTVNVNLSSRQFLEADLVDFVRGVLEETALRPEHLKLEVTESLLMQHSEVVTVAFKQLKTLGVKLYVDDFGTGYSSLSYLQRFPVDTLKIDRSFVHNMVDSPESAELVRTIITMAQALNLNVVAEGVETQEQLAQLEALGCSYGQGYLFDTPLEVDAATSLLYAAKTDRQLSPLDVPDERGSLTTP